MARIIALLAVTFFIFIIYALYRPTEPVLIFETREASYSTSTPEPARAVTVAPALISPTKKDAATPISPAETDAQAPLPKREPSFYRDPNAQAIRVAKELDASGSSEKARRIEKIAQVSQGVWIIGKEEEKLLKLVADAKTRNEVPIIVIYNIPDHTTLAWGSGIKDSLDYKSWISRVGDVLRDSNAWVILEPDTIGLAPNLKKEDQLARIGDLANAARVLKRKAPRIRIYLDGGHSRWREAKVFAEFLTKGGIKEADGFFINVANYQELASETAYGKELSKILGGKHFVIDTGRNGKHLEGTSWCNPSGARIGKLPTSNTGGSLIDAYLWIKPPGESDGYCNNGPAPGKFWLERALELTEDL